MDPAIRGTRAIRVTNAVNFKIVTCRFSGFTNGSAYISGNNVTISKNSFYHGSYRTQTVRLDKSKNVTVSDNLFDDNGPHYYMVLGSPNEMASVDALMVGYQVENAQITNNRIKNTAAIGIRVENSKNVHVVGNTLENIGESGIVFYRKTYDCYCTDNVIKYWGRSNNLSYIRKQDGKIYNPKEYHYQPPKFPALPDKLDTAATWELNRYFLQGRDESTIPEYNSQDYKTILAFRGYAAISVEELSERVVISENQITGNTTKTGGLYNYASNFGISIGVTSINPPTSSGDCVITKNTIKDCIDFDIYCPKYVDPTSKRGVAKPSRVLGNDCDPTKINFFYLKT
jgi:parallel beta-helix repeat protein